MTAFAKAHQIVFMMCATSRKRNDVVYFLYWSELALLLAQFTNRMFLDVKLAYLPPSVTITFVGLAYICCTVFRLTLCVSHNIFLPITQGNAATCMGSSAFLAFKYTPLTNKSLSLFSSEGSSNLFLAIIIVQH